jgi:hypothetical protein
VARIAPATSNYALLFWHQPFSAIQVRPCYAHWSDTEHVVGNEHGERKWKMEGESLRAVSFYDRGTHRKWPNLATKEAVDIPPAPGALTIAAAMGSPGLISK